MASASAKVSAKGNSNGNAADSSEPLLRRRKQAENGDVDAVAPASADEQALLREFQDSADEKKKSGAATREYDDDGSLISSWDQLEAIVGPILFTGIALFTRLYQISKSTQVTWDEAHFGKFGSYYLKHEYYFDVHPPLGKMLVGLSGYLAGYNGSFEFESGANYPDYLDFSVMRTFNALFSVVCVPMAYYTAKRLKLSKWAVWLLSLMLALENSNITLAKFILLDSMLICFTVSTVFCLVSFHEYNVKSPFSVEWFTWLLLTGISIGCVCSVKMVGLFATALVGIYTVVDLWIRFGDLTIPKLKYAAHWVTRIVFLILVPLSIFMLCFKIHFMLLTHSGPGDANMSSLFQANLIGNSMEAGPADVAYGSRITLKNQGLNGGLLHSHVQLFPEGSGQQQVTTYAHKDANNDWIVEYKRWDGAYNAETDPIRKLQSGDVIRLFHPSTGRNLHTHQIAAPVTKGKWEVSCYGNDTIGDEKDNWTVEIMENPGDEDPDIVHPISTSIRLYNQDMGCYLTGEGNSLPAWGFRQGEVTCTTNPIRRDKRTWWNVEDNTNDRLPRAENRTLPKTHFLRDFIQLNFAQMASNNALVPDADKQDDLASLAWEWPTLHTGLRLCGWGEENVRYYLLGHVSSTWLSSIGILVFGVLTLYYLARWQRSFVDFDTMQLLHYAIAGVVPALGWFLHYLPFIVMSRVTYVHHYLPALYFALLLFAFLVDHFTAKAKYLVRAGVYLALYALTIGVFILYSPISFGMTGNVDQYNYLNLLKNWKI